MFFNITLTDTSLWELTVLASYISNILRNLCVCAYLTLAFFVCAILVAILSLLELICSQVSLAKDILNSLRLAE